MKKPLALLCLFLLPMSALANDYIVDARKDILTSYPDSCRVTILESSTETSYTHLIPRLFWTYDEIRLAEDGGLVLLDEFQVGTHAKGATELLSEAFTVTVPATLTSCDPPSHTDGIRAAATSSLNKTLTATIPAGYMITGPEEDAPYNSRVYFLRVYGHHGTLTADAQPWLIGAPVKITGAYTEPLIWVLYAVDLYIEPLGGTP